MFRWMSQSPSMKPVSVSFLLSPAMHSIISESGWFANSLTPSGRNQESVNRCQLWPFRTIGKPPLHSSKHTTGSFLSARNVCLQCKCIAPLWLKIPLEWFLGAAVVWSDTDHQPTAITAGVERLSRSVSTQHAEFLIIGEPFRRRMADSASNCTKISAEYSCFLPFKLILRNLARTTKSSGVGIRGADDVHVWN